MPAEKRDAALLELEVLGDHPAMNLLNTVARLQGELVDLWQSDADVAGWLVRMGFVPQAVKPALQPGKLLEAACRLREIVRKLVTQRKAGARLDGAPLNAFLAESRSYCQLKRSKGGALQITRQYDERTPEQILTPLAESAAEFLAAANFRLVRRCEGEGCVLWFYDRTKSHRRRWCSMSACGNRHKVAAFRSRSIKQA